MAKRHFISVLGTNNYTPTRYICNGEGVVTPYVQEAVLKLKMLGKSEYTSEDRITIFVTEEAERSNWHDRDYTQDELKRMNRAVETGRKTGLYSILQKAYGITEDAARLIPLGATEDELWEIFNRIYEEIRDGEELYVDITHSMRNIPIQMLSVIAYARVLKNIQVKGIYYGAFEARTKNAEGMTEAPIFDLMTFLDILDWSQAANSFIKYGNSDEIKALYYAQKDRRSRDLERVRVIGALSEITQGLETSRGCFKEEKGSGAPGISVLKSYRSYEKFYENMQEKEKEVQGGDGQKKQIDPLSKLFDVIDDKVKVFDVEDNFAFGLAAIDWAIENKKTQQGFTALDETIKTWLCRRYGLNEYLERHREGICKLICNLFCGRTWRSGDSQAVFSAEGRAGIYREWEEIWESRGYGQREKTEGDKNAPAPEDERKAAYRIAMELHPVLPKISGEISSRRNSMNHFGYSNINQFGSRKLSDELVEYNKKFREAIALMENGGEEQGCGQ